MPTYNTVAEMTADSANILAQGFSSAFLMGRDAAGDGGMAIWLISNSGTANGHNVLDIGNGLFATLGKHSVYTMAMVGAFASTSGSNFAAKMLALFTQMSTTGGGDTLHYRDS